MKRFRVVFLFICLLVCFLTLELPISHADTSLTTSPFEVFYPAFADESVGITSTWDPKDSSVNAVESGSGNEHYFAFKSMDFGANGLADIRIKQASNLSGVNVGQYYSGTAVEVRIGSKTGTLIGVFRAKRTGNWQNWEATYVRMNQVVTGVNDVYFVVKMPSIVIKSIEFIERQPYRQITAVTADIMSGVSETWDSKDDVFGKLEPTKENEIHYFAFLNYNFGDLGLDTVLIRQASNNSSVDIGMTFAETNIEIRLDSPNGELVGTFIAKRTGDWNNWSVLEANITKTVRGERDIYFVVKQINSTYKSIEFVERNYRSAYSYFDSGEADFSVGMTLSRDPVTGREAFEANTSFSQNYYVFEDIDFGNPGLKQIYFDQASNKDSVAIGNTYIETNLEVRLDNPNGTLVAALNGKRTGDWFNFTEVNVNVTADVTGRHDIYVIAKQPSFLIRSIRMEQKNFTSIINSQSTSSFASYNSIINRPTTSGVPAYNYCPFIVKLSNDLGGGYRTYFGGRWLSSAGDGDHVFQYRSSSGVANSWSMYGNGPQFWQGREEGNGSKWFADNVLEPEVMRLPDGNWAMYTQVQIDPGKVIDDGNDSVAVAQADRILLLTSNDGNKWYRKEDSSVITNITNPTATACHHQELVYVPWDENGKCYWMYIAVNENNVYKGYYRIRSNRYDNFNFAARERVSGMIQLGNQIGYLKQTDGGPIFVRITFADYDGRLVPALQYSTNGLSWSGIINYLAGSTDNNNNKNCYFMGFSTINGTGEMIYEGNNTWSFLYAATTSNSPVQPEIWHSAIGGGNAQIILS